MAIVCYLMYTFVILDVCNDVSLLSELWIIHRDYIFITIHHISIPFTMEEQWYWEISLPKRISFDSGLAWLQDTLMRWVGVDLIT